MASVTNSFSANTKIKSAAVNTNFQDVVDEFDTTTGHNHDGTDSKLIYTGGDYHRRIYVPISQAQSLTVSRGTVGAIPAGGAGFVRLHFGGNAPADRFGKSQDYSWLESGGTIFFNTSGEFAVSGGVTAAAMTFTAVNSGGNIVVQTVTSAFGGGSVVGLLIIDVGATSTAITLLKDQKQKILILRL